VLGQRLAGATWCLTDAAGEVIRAVVAWRGGARRSPGPESIGLVVEVADSSLEQDCEIKARIYARAGIRLYWIINLVESKLEVFEHPSGSGAAPAYKSRRAYELTEAVPLVLGGQAVGPVVVRELFPGAVGGAGTA
jgi:hypothetical protein